MLKAFNTISGKVDEYDAFFETFASRPEVSVSELLDQTNESDKLSCLRFVDLTSTGIPLPWIADAAGHYTWSSGRATKRSNAAQVEHPRVAFLGNVEFAGPNPMIVDDHNRQVRFTAESESLLTYPTCDNFKISMSYSERPLPYSAYERWLLEDACLLRGASLRCFVGSAATRRSFLETNWREYSCLHVSTHGQAFSAFHECSWLRLAGKDRASFVDILSLDWSSLQLVFLNACMTGVGQRQSGETSSSLGWAFLAGGARAVIATQWPVPDDVAFQFAKCFYERLFGAEWFDVEEAFGEAMRDFRRTHNPKPHAWGAYVLLT